MTTNHEHTVDAATAAIASKATTAGAAGAVLGWLSSSEAGVVLGIAIGVAGLLVNWYYKYKQDKREERALQLEIERARESKNGS